MHQLVVCWPVSSGVFDVYAKLGATIFIEKSRKMNAFFFVTVKQLVEAANEWFVLQG